MRVYYEILNQKGTPAFYSDTYTNRPTYGFAGRVFISTDTGQIFEDTGSAWSLIADAGVGGGTLASVTANGNSTATGIVITANGLSSNSITNTGNTLGSVLFAGASGLESQSNATFFWDNTNKRLGIGNASPGAPLDIHGTGTQIQVNGTGANNSYIQFQNAGVSKWRIGNTYNGAANTFDLYNNSLTSTALSFNVTTNAATFNNSITATSVSISGGTSAQFLKADGTTDSNTYLTTSSASSTYLPLAGGTLTGALSGTSITGTSLIKSGGTSAQILAADGSVITAGTNITISSGTISSSGGGSMAIGGSITSATAGSVLYAGASGVLAQSNANFYFDYTNNRLGLGTNTIGSTLQTNGGAAIGYSTSTAAPTNGLVVAGNMGLGTTTIASATSDMLTISKNQNAATRAIVSNTTSGTSSVAEINLTSNTTAGSFNIGKYSATTSTYKNFVSNSAYLYNGTAGNIAFLNDFASGGFNISVGASSTAQFVITSAGIINTTSRLNVNGATDNSVFSLNSGGTLYTAGFSPNATANSTNTLTLTTAQTTWIYNGTGVATWTLYNPSGTNQMIWIKNAGTGIITLNAYSGTNIINNSGTSVSSITIAVGATALIQQDGNVKSYQLQ